MIVALDYLFLFNDYKKSWWDSLPWLKLASANVQQRKERQKTEEGGKLWRNPYSKTRRNIFTTGCFWCRIFWCKMRYYWDCIRQLIPLFNSGMCPLMLEDAYYYLLIYKAAIWVLFKGMPGTITVICYCNKRISYYTNVTLLKLSWYFFPVMSCYRG